MQLKIKKNKNLLIILKKIRSKVQNLFALFLHKIFSLFLFSSTLNPKIIHICFSFDRALQLENYIKTFKANYKHDLNIDFFVIYKYSSEVHFNCYEKLISKFNEIKFIKESNFKQDINKILKNYSSNHILFFGVDDIEFIRAFSLRDIHSQINTHVSLKKKKIIFSLRHGLNLNKSIQCRLDKMDLPLNLKFEDKYLSWKFRFGKGEWGYPLAVDCHFFLLRDLKTFIKFAYFYSPNSLEASLQTLKKEFNSSVGISYKKSICFNNPNNKVQNEYDNYSLNSNKDFLAKKYLEGFIIKQKKDILKIQNSTHIAFDYELTKGGE